MYRHLYFDFDHTLWDYDRNAAETLAELYAEHALAAHGFTSDALVKAYHRANYALWERFHGQEISKEALREQRFPLVAETLGVPPSVLPEAFNEAFLRRCPTKPHVIRHAHRVLSYLRDRGYRLHLLTNGFSDVQYQKLAAARLAPFFEAVFTADAVGYRKPQPEFFAHALTHTAARPGECLMIGDSLDADVRGARAARIDTVYFNPAGTPHTEAVTHEIRCLSELTSLL